MTGIFRSLFLLICSGNKNSKSTYIFIQQQRKFIRWIMFIQFRSLTWNALHLNLLERFFSAFVVLVFITFILSFLCSFCYFNGFCFCLPGFYTYGNLRICVIACNFTLFGAIDVRRIIWIPSKRELCKFSVGIFSFAIFIRNSRIWMRGGKNTFVHLFFKWQTLVKWLLSRKLVSLSPQDHQLITNSKILL